MLQEGAEAGGSWRTQSPLTAPHPRYLLMTKGKIPTLQQRNLADTLDSSRSAPPQRDTAASWALVRGTSRGTRSLLWYSCPKCKTSVSLFKNIRQTKIEGILSNNSAVSTLSLKVMEDKGRLRDRHQVQGTKGTWQQNAMWGAPRWLSHLSVWLLGSGSDLRVVRSRQWHWDPRALGSLLLSLSFTMPPTLSQINKPIF